MGILDGRVAIVTGSGRGIGREFALCMAREGASVVINDVGVSLDGQGTEDDPAAQTCKDIEALGARAVPSYESVSDFEGAGRIVETAIREFGRIDILVNNAGIVRDRSLLKMSEEDFDAVVAVHMKGTFNLCKHAAVVFRQQRSGRFINTGSESGLGSPGQPNYAAAKEGIVGLTRSLAVAMSRYNCTANAVRPRAATRMTLSPEMEAAARARRERGEAGEGTDAMNLAALDPGVVGSLVAFLASDEAAEINGRDFLVAGNEIGVFTIPFVEARVFSSGPVWTTDEVFARFNATLGKVVASGRGPGM
jgi:NAD(P)-dependent dehydrogenase (short-subunit alcohol dehydrogenase family)